MDNYILLFTKTFKKEFAKLSQPDRQKVLDKIKVLADNPFYPSLRSRKLRGAFSEYYESSVNMDIRVIWRFDGGRLIVMLDVGHHDVLNKY